MSLKHVKNVVLILSGKGGVGKSSITTQLALSLSLQGHNVGILDIDLTGPSIPRLLGIEDSKVTQSPSGWMPVEVHDAQQLHSTNTGAIPADVLENESSLLENATPLQSPKLDDIQQEQGHDNDPPTKVGSLHAMSLAFLLASRSTAIVWRGPKKTAMVRQFLSTVDWPKQTDYLLVDTPPGTSDEHISLVETLLKEMSGQDEVQQVQGVQSSLSDQKPSLAGAVIVTTPQAVAVSDVRKELNFCAKTGVRILGVVENMSGYVCPCCGEATNLFSKGGGQIMAMDFKVPFLGSVPVDPLWGLLVEEGKRPKYEKADADATAAPADGSDEENEEDEEAPLSDRTKKEREPGLLVEKYRDCSLSVVFARIAQEVHNRTEQGAAVLLT